MPARFTNVAGRPRARPRSHREAVVCRQGLAVHAPRQHDAAARVERLPRVRGVWEIRCAACRRNALLLGDARMQCSGKRPSSRGKAGSVAGGREGRCHMCVLRLRNHLVERDGYVVVHLGLAVPVQALGICSRLQAQYSRLVTRGSSANQRGRRPLQIDRQPATERRSAKPAKRARARTQAPESTRAYALCSASASLTRRMTCFGCPLPPLPPPCPAL